MVYHAVDSGAFAVFDDPQPGPFRLDNGHGGVIATGSSDSDVLAGTDDDDVLYGYDDADILEGQAGTDILDGGKGVDILEGGDGDDLLRAGDGLDVLKGGTGNDVLQGGFGNDFFGGGAGDDSLNGGGRVEDTPNDGTDIASYAGAEHGLRMVLGSKDQTTAAGVYTIEDDGYGGRDVLFSIERITATEHSGHA
ncbi:MAG: calcium-binding protein [Rhodoplanes sp.]